MREKPNVAADGVVVRDGGVLLIKRKTEPYKECWAIPGGMIERGETLKETCAREVFEETGLKVTPLKMLGVFDNPERDPRWVITVFFLCKVVGGNLVKQTNETEDIGFFTEEQIREMDIAFDHREMISKAILEGFE